MESKDDTAVTLTERRRAIYEHAVERHRNRGTHIDNDSLFVSLMEKWIEGELDMQEVAARSSPRFRKGEHRDVQSKTGVTDSSMTNEQLLSELDRIIGIHEAPSSNSS